MKSAMREIIETIILALLIFFAVRTVVENFKVEGSSMEPNLHDGDYLIVNKLVYFHIDWDRIDRVLPFLKQKQEGVLYFFHPPQRGDIVVFRFPIDPSREFVKRVIAIPGEMVEIKANKVYVDGIELDEPYVPVSPGYPLPLQEVPPDHYFVLGDNRNNSSDSHIWGMVPQENIVGKAWFTYWPINRWGMAPNYSLVNALSTS